MGFKAITEQAQNRSGFRYQDTDKNSTKSLLTIFDRKTFWNVKQAPHTQLQAHEKDRNLRVEHSLPELKINTRTKEPYDAQFARLNENQKERLIEKYKEQLKVSFYKPDPPAIR